MSEQVYKLHHNIEADRPEGISTKSKVVVLPTPIVESPSLQRCVIKRGEMRGDKPDEIRIAGGERDCTKPASLLAKPNTTRSLLVVFALRTHPYTD